VQTQTQQAPARPSYEVKAVFLDRDPTAVLLTGGRTVIVRVGDVVNGERVVAIDASGVTIEGDEGARRRYALTSSE
jgi:hypothetical protein